MRDIFRLYLECGGLTPTVEELSRRKWVNKRWTTRKGTVRGARPFHKGTLHHLLTNVTYRGKVKHRDELYEGDHEPLVSEEVFQAVQDLLAQNRRAQRRRRANRCPGLLEGLLYCAPCRSRMVHTYTTRGPRRYRYYICSGAQRRGWDTCPSKSIPATETERFVVREVHSSCQEEAAGSEAGWDSRSTPEQAQMLTRLVERIEYDGRRGDLSIRLTNDARGEKSE